MMIDLCVYKRVVFAWNFIVSFGLCMGLALSLFGDSGWVYLIKLGKKLAFLLIESFKLLLNLILANFYDWRLVNTFLQQLRTDYSNYFINLSNFYMLLNFCLVACGFIVFLYGLLCHPKLNHVSLGSIKLLL